MRMNLAAFYTVLFLSAHFHPLQMLETTSSYIAETTQSATSEPVQPSVDVRAARERMAAQLATLVNIDFVVTLILGSLAIFGNIIILIVTAHYKCIGIAEVYMVGLAVCDLSIGISTSWRALADRVYTWSAGVYGFCALTYWPVGGVEIAASTTASLIAMALSIDRCFALRFPIKHSELSSVRKAKIITVVSGLISIIIGLNYPLRLTIIEEGISFLNIMPTKYTSLGEDAVFSKLCRYIEFFFRFAIPLSTMTFANTWTMAIIHKSDQFRKKIDKEARSTMNTPKCLTMTIGLVIIFIITQMLKAAFLLDQMIFHSAHRGIKAFEIFIIVGNLMTKFNSIVNIMVYLLLNTEFRRTLLKVLNVCKTSDNEISSLATLTTTNGPEKRDVASRI
ncbi:hypothetical protein CAPTEDRAFT_199307 [Capitella teleta]|uniref:G-protein coupled receptors family 1 profile domain-containing protein n=1 Tax=Capitella teleta TaxID=283909 RepID=R7T4W0_CAPTE|nr:hypothetical protein CAPTEDRAFT_199307 [Capitella teleta]|eukprot:ELT87951.1 hypothetical protein CAPTEDRAFT_199307 [Capitella teleta]